MKKILLIFTFIFTLIPLHAQQNMKELFKSMPDSIIPLLTKNNRLDMIDFLEAKMRSVVTNKLDGETEMTAISNDSITIKLTDVLQIEMFLLPAEEEYDSCKQVICVLSKYSLPSSAEKENDVRREELVARFYSVQWNPLQNPSLQTPVKTYSTILSDDEKVFAKKPVY